MRKHLQKHKSSIYAGTFALMTLVPIGLYYAAQLEASSVVWTLLGLVISANLLVLWVR